jgi:hypothetical protein
VNRYTALEGDNLREGEGNIENNEATTPLDVSLLYFSVSIPASGEYSLLGSAQNGGQKDEDCCS